MFDGIKSSFEKKELATPEVGSMCYMMSSHGYLGAVGHWYPHLMFFLPSTEGAALGAGMKGSPILADQDTPDHLTVFMIPVGKWSDGTAAPIYEDGK